MNKSVFNLLTLLAITGCAGYNTVSVNTTLDGTDFGYIDISDNGTSWHKEQYNLRKRGEWAVSFDYGLVKGTAKCSAYRGTYDVVNGYNTENSKWTANETMLLSVDGKTTNCWCSLAEIVMQNKTYQSGQNILWMFNGDNRSSDDCEVFCTAKCAKEIKNNSDFRQSIFNIFEK